MARAHKGKWAFRILGGKSTWGTGTRYGGRAPGSAPFPPEGGGERLIKDLNRQASSLSRGSEHCEQAFPFPLPLVELIQKIST
jgi:hypothetical protein